MSKGNNIILSGVVDISSAESIYGEFEKLLSNGGDITIKCDEVDRVDTSIMQIVLAAKVSLEEHHCKLIWDSPSEAMLNTVRLLGTKDFLECNNA
ncbi:MAG: STAS domain-containing protein [Pseudomonadales bacterium]|nr:STAS domain-containing protein [Pseudomonadales bacterium]